MNLLMNLLLKHFGTVSLKGFGVENIESGIVAAGAALLILRKRSTIDSAHL